MPSKGLVILFFGCKSHISIDRKCRLIRKWKATDAAASDGARSREVLLYKTNTASGVWADTVCRSKANDVVIDKESYVSKVYRKMPHLKSIPRGSMQGGIRLRVEHVFAYQTSQMVLFVRTEGITRAIMRGYPANITYSMRRFLFLEKLNASA